MGKRRGHDGHAPAKRPSSGDALVVVNPSMLQSSARVPSQQSQSRKKNGPSSAKKRKGGPTGDASVHQRLLKKKKMDRVMVANVAVTSATRLSRSEGGGATTSVLRVKRDADLLGGLYWVLHVRNTPRPCVVALPSHDETSSAQLVAMLKHLQVQAVALHHKMTVSQRSETVHRLKSAVASTPALATVLVTTDQLLASAGGEKADAVLVGAVSEKAVEAATTKFLHVHQVTSEPVGSAGEAFGVSVFRPELTTGCLQQVQARLRLAKQIVEISQRVGTAGGAQDDDKWARKLAKGADLEEEEDSGKKKRKRAMTPDEQRLQSLTEKVYVQLARKLPGTHPKNSRAPVGGSHEADSQHRREKLEVLGLVTVNAAVGTAMTDERTSAQTRWMDFAQAKAYGGQWEGAVRHGASKDATSLELRKKVCSAQGEPKSSNFLSKWSPNKEPVDTEKWGGVFGKPCGHNEVVMHSLRAFYPQEVLNSKVCSKLFPAPGNQGFDGCLEHLRLACMDKSTSMTLWDAEYFIYISSRGNVTWAKKSQLLSLPLASLQCLVPALRSWTAACGGHKPPSAILRAVQLCCQLGSGDKHSSDAKLPPKVLKRIMSFAFGGSARLWKQIAKIPTPLEEEAVY